MQKFKAEDGASLDGTAVDRDGFKAGTRYLAKVINDNQWNVFEVVETAGYTLIDDDLSQLAKAVKSPYNQSYTYNTSAIATQTVSDVVLGSDGAYYEVLNDGVSNDDPVTNLNGNWKKIPFKVSPAVNDDEALSKGQLLAAIKEVDGSGSGIDADKLDGLEASNFANMQGDNTQTFKVATAVNADEAVSKAQMDSGLGNKADKADVIGINQTWQNVLASRSDNVTYTNSTGKPIMVAVSYNASSNGNDEFYVNGVKIASNVLPGGEDITMTFIVPDGDTYKANTSNSFRSWFELR